LREVWKNRLIAGGSATLEDDGARQVAAGATTRAELQRIGL
jgi:hypothetical protein